MKKNIIIDDTLRVIRISKKFYQKATNAESTEYNTLRSVKSEHPTYSISIGVIKKKENKESYRGLTYEYMERYIEVYGNEGDLDYYKELRFLSECHSVKYPVIKQWFLNKYPDIANYGIREEILSNTTHAA
ncbi:MAG: hypothetical protein E7607_04625 [Ruminococcaceae bacterium]|nr:hypothetical protein [Oscillospiraceae bacterium]